MDAKSTCACNPMRTEEDPLEKNLYVDGHVDLPYFMMHAAPELKFSGLKDAPFTIDKARDSGVRLFCAALYCEDKYNGLKSLQNLMRLYDFTIAGLDAVNMLKRPGDILKLKQESDALGTILLMENADALADDISLIEELREMGFGIVGLTHSGGNRLADGNSVVHPGGITGKGRDVVRSLKPNGLIVDVAHLHEKCFWQLLDLMDGPVVSSHTGIREIFDVPRNIYLEQAGEILERGGMIGITLNPEMLSGAHCPGLEQAFSHVDTFVQRFGPIGVGLGSDLCGFDKTLQEGGDIMAIHDLMEMMLAHGYSARAVGQIMGANWLEFFEKNLEL